MVEFDGKRYREVEDKNNILCNGRCAFRVNEYPNYCKLGAKAKCASIGRDDGKSIHYEEIRRDE